MISKRSLVLPTMLLLLMVWAEGQLTFSPDWGKRSESMHGTSGHVFDTQMEKCKTSKEILLEIFRFVQTEAQLFRDCKHRE